jgi:hypothetical protein
MQEECSPSLGHPPAQDTHSNRLNKQLKPLNPRESLQLYQATAHARIAYTLLLPHLAHRPCDGGAP